MNILISPSSFLPPNKSLWKNLSSLSSKLDFAEYNNLIMSFNKLDDYDLLILLIFLQDYNFENKENIFDLIINNLTVSLKKNKLIFIAISSYFYNNLIRVSKKQPSNIISFNNFKSNLYDISIHNPNLFIIDLDVIYSKLGYENIFDSRNWYYSHLRLSQKGIQITDEAFSSVINRSLEPEKKLLILDCDNTLWGGVIGEDDLNGLIIGNEGIGLAYKEFQLAIKKLKSEGLILAICSKNYEKDVNFVFENHKEMVLTKNDIVISKINWDEKTENIKNIANDLSIGLNSIVFWDDNPLEREKVKIALPEVCVVEVPKEINLWPQLILESNLFAKSNLSKEDITKTEQYKMREKFKKIEKKTFNKFKFLKQIGLKPSIKKLTTNDLSRAIQLCKKTNQFNLSTKRYSEKDLLIFLQDNSYDLFIISAVDRFGDHGKIGLAIIKYQIDNAFLDSFILSCRILGRYIEFWLLQTLINKIKQKKIGTLLIEYKKTERNVIVKDFLDSCKFILKKELLNKNNTLQIKVSSESKIINVNSLYE